MAMVLPNLAMLFPRTEIVTLAGRRYRAIQLRLGTIARIEDDFELLVKHPSVGIEDSLAIVKKGRKEPGWVDHSRIVIRRYGDWPPAFGSKDFRRIMATPEGSALFLGIMLRRSNRPISDSAIVDVAMEMTAECWDALERVAWGFRPWMAFGSDEPQSSHPGRGINWAEATYELAQRGYTFHQISRLFVNQFMNIRGGGQPWRVKLSDPPLT